MHPKRKPWRSKFKQKQLRMEFYIFVILLCEVIAWSVMNSFHSLEVPTATITLDGLARAYPIKKVSCSREASGDIIFKSLPWTEETSVASVVLLMKHRCPTRLQSFRFSFLREPTQRAVEEFFSEHVSRQKYDPTDTIFKEKVMMMDGDLYQRELGFEPPTHGLTEQVVTSILNGYDFIGIAERLDESLVVMKMLMGLETKDILYLPEVGPFTPWYFNSSVPKCTFRGITPFISTTMSQFFASETWQTKVAGDTLLFQTTNRSLDMTITALGAERFHNELMDYYHAMEAAQNACVVMHLCTSSGNLISQHDCQFRNMGCGFRCLDAM